MGLADKVKRQAALASNQPSAPPPSAPPLPPAYPQTDTYPPPPTAYPPQATAQPPLLPGFPEPSNNTPPDSNHIARLLRAAIHENSLQGFYDDKKIWEVATRVAALDFDAISKEFMIDKEFAYEFVPLALYDVVFFCDDSGSMRFEENGTRIDDLRFILDKVTTLVSRFDDDGITVRFMNSDTEGNNVRTVNDVHQLLKNVNFSGGTPLGEEFEKRVVKPFANPGFLRKMPKPVLAFIITDGAPTDNARIVSVIEHAKKNLASTSYGPKALAIQIAQVGRDVNAQRFLKSIDNHSVIGDMVDCTSYYEMEEEEVRLATGQQLTPEMWLMKMCLGAISKAWDNKDDNKD